MAAFGTFTIVKADNSCGCCGQKQPLEGVLEKAVLETLKNKNKLLENLAKSLRNTF